MSKDAKTELLLPMLEKLSETAAHMQQRIHTEEVDFLVDALRASREHLLDAIESEEKNPHETLLECYRHTAIQSAGIARELSAMIGVKLTSRFDGDPPVTEKQLQTNSRRATVAFASDGPFRVALIWHNLSELNKSLCEAASLQTRQASLLDMFSIGTTMAPAGTNSADAKRELAAV